MRKLTPPHATPAPLGATEVWPDSYYCSNSDVYRAVEVYDDLVVLESCRNYDVFVISREELVESLWAI